MIRNLFGFVLFLVLPCVSVTQAQSAESIAKVVALSGSPTAGGRTLTVGSAIFEHDKISTGGGNVQILFVDNTKLVLGPSSSLVVEKFLMRGSGTAQKFSINALRGTFRFITGNSAKSAYNIKTANATIGIRGTGFDFWVKGDTGVAVHKGNVKLCNLTHSCVDLSSGCDLGLAKSNEATELNGQSKSNGLTRKLPYTINQRPLNNAFHLNTGACQKYVLVDSGGQGAQEPPQKLRGKDQLPPPQESPPLPSTHCDGKPSCGKGNHGNGTDNEGHK